MLSKTEEHENKYTSTEPVRFGSELMPEGWTYDIIKNGKLHGTVYHVGSKESTEADAAHVLGGMNMTCRVIGGKRGNNPKNQIQFGKNCQGVS